MIVLSLRLLGGEMIVKDLFNDEENDPSGRVVRRIRNEDGKIQGTRNDNPIIDTRVYEVVFPEGEVSEYGAIVIAANMWAQCDLDGNQQLLMDANIDRRIDDSAIKLVDAFVYVNGCCYSKKTTHGVHLCVQWMQI
jgi:hypothetical protein